MLLLRECSAQCLPYLLDMDQNTITETLGFLSQEQVYACELVPVRCGQSILT
jgi:hypothetical protein